MFTSTSGVALTALKARLNAGGLGSDLHHVLFRAGVTVDDRADILQHFAVQAQHADVARLQLMQVISDFDDTIVQAWLDKRYPKSTVYPGARAVCY